MSPQEEGRAGSRLADPRQAGRRHLHAGRRPACRIYNAQKCGHGGTLDPLASGILPMAFGEATKTVGYVMEADKDYVFTIRWGSSTTTQDREGEVTGTSDVRPSRAAIEAALATFVGEIEQVPPQYSAIKVNGERAYDLGPRWRDGGVGLTQGKPLRGRARGRALRRPRGHQGNRAEKAFISGLWSVISPPLWGPKATSRPLRRTRVGAFAEDAAIQLSNSSANER